MSRLESIFQTVRRIIVKNKYKSDNRNTNLWLFGEWFGKSCCDNSLYLANYIKTNYPNIKVVWVTLPKTDLSLLNNNIDVVYFDSENIKKVFSEAGVVVFNQNFKDFSIEGYNYFDGAIIINLWHGVPWKKIGYDASRKHGIIHEISIRINDYIDNSSLYLVQSERNADCLKTAYKISSDKLLRSGSPRNSIFHSSIKQKEERNKLLDVLKMRGFDLGINPYFIVYMPTFRDSTSRVYDITSLSHNDELNKWMNENNIFILQKSHFASAGTFKSNCDNNRIFLFNDFSATELMAASNMLITDYSSCFFDYLIMNKPIIHYLYDYQFYRNDDRGLYYKYEDVVCGDVAWNEEEMISFIVMNYQDGKRNEDLRKIRFQEYVTYESPYSCQNVVDAINMRLEK